MHARPGWKRRFCVPWRAVVSSKPGCSASQHASQSESNNQIVATHGFSESMDLCGGTH